MSLLVLMNPPGKKMAKKRKARKGKGRGKVHHFQFATGSRKARKGVKRALVAGGWADIGRASGATYLNPYHSPYQSSRLHGLGLRQNGPALASANSYMMSLKRGKKASSAQKRHIMGKVIEGRRTYGWGTMVKTGPRTGQIRLNPMGGGVVSIVKTAAGMGSGVLLAQKVIPALAGRVLPAVATRGPIGLAVNTVGAIVVGRVLGKALKSPALAGQVMAGAITSLGVNLLGMLVRYLPAGVTGPLGLSGMAGVVSAGELIRDEALYSPSMRDYLQLSGPVPADLFAGGMNDYVNFQGQAAGAAAEAISAQETEWTPPANEQF